MAPPELTPGRAAVDGNAAEWRRRFLGVFPSLVLPIFLAVIDQSIVSAALPAIAFSLSVTSRISWVVVAYLVAGTIAAPVYGRLGDVFGRRRLIVFALGILIGASILCSMSRSIEALTAARALQGLGGGGLMTLSQALIGEALPARERARYEGWIASVIMCSTAVGPVLGGVLTQHFGWQAVFLMNIPVGLSAAIIALRLESKGGSAEGFQFDMPGLVLFAAFILSTLAMLEILQGSLPGNARAALPLFGAAVAAAGLLVWRESVAPSPLLSVPHLRHPVIWRCASLAACHGAMLVSLMTFVPLYMRMVHATSAARTGLLLLPLTVGIGFGALVTGRLVGRTGKTAVFPSVGLTVVASGLVLLSFGAPHLTATQASLSFGLIALFMGTVMSVIQPTVQAAAGTRRLGESLAALQFSRSLGAAIGTTITGGVLFSTMAAADPNAGRLAELLLQNGPDAINGLTDAGIQSVTQLMDHAFRNAFLCIASFAVLAMQFAYSLPLRRL